MLKINPEFFKEGYNYRYNYPELFQAVAEKKLNDLEVYRTLIKTDLWFIVAFILEIPNSNRPFVIDRCNEIQDEEDRLQKGEKIDWTLDLWARLHFKMVDLNELVPTPFGWRKHGDLEIGNEVFNVNGHPTKIIGKSEIFKNIDCYKVFFDKGYSVTVGGDHLWNVYIHFRQRINKNKRTKTKKVILTTKQLKEEVDWSRKIKSRTFPFVDVCKPIQYSEKKLSINPYVLGAWLGDGNCSWGSITCGDKELFDEISKTDLIGKDKTPRRTSEFRNISGLGARLRELNLINNKHIPSQYLFSSITQRIDLLQGLMDTDGTCDTRGTATFCNKNKQLAQDVFELAASLGLKPSIRSHKTKYKGERYDFWHISFQAYIDSFPVFRLNRKQIKAVNIPKYRLRKHSIINIEKIDSIPCSCIQVNAEDGQYLIGKHFIPTHNSSILTKARTIQRVVNYPDKCTMLGSHTRPMAKKLLRSLMFTIEQNVILKKGFPNIFYKNPRNESPKYSEDDGIIVKRSNFSRTESTIEAWGIKEGMPIGVHFDFIILDDLETRDDIRNPDVVLKGREAIDLVRYLKTEDGHISIVGTPYSHEGIYVPYIILKKKANGKPLYKYRCYPGTSDGTRLGKPVMMTQEELNDLFADVGSEYQVNCQILINPTPVGGRMLYSELLKEINPERIPKNLYKFMLIDPAGDDTRGDAWAIGVFGVEPYIDDIGASTVYILDLIASPMKRTAAVESAIRMYMRNGMILQVGVERAGLSDFEINVAGALRVHGRIVSIESGSLVILKPAGRIKERRIEETLGWALNNGKIYISEAIPIIYKERFKNEMDKFPYWHDDICDITAYLYDMLKAYKFMPRRILKDRDPVGRGAHDWLGT